MFIASNLYHEPCYATRVAKALLLSVCIALVAIPLMTARDVHPARGLKRALFGVVLFNLFYVVVLRVILPRFG